MEPTLVVTVTLAVSVAFVVIVVQTLNRKMFKKIAANFIYSKDYCYF